MPPLVIRLIRYSLIGIGALTLMSAVVNIIGAIELIDAVAEDSLGFTRQDVIRWYILPAILGIGLIAAGIFWRRKQ